MSSSPIDYDALAKQYGGTATVDYDALAAKFGGSVQNAQPENAPSLHAAQPEPWLMQLDEDLRQGGGRTIIGRTLGHLQGRGDAGYSGMESGTSKGAADFVGSVPLGLTKTAQGLSEIPNKPVQGVLDTGKGLLQTATIPGSFIAPEVSEAATPAVQSAVAKIMPSGRMEAAGGLLQSVAHDANKIPVSLDNSGDAALKLMDWQKKTQLGPTINKYLNRITNPKLGPMTYEEARDYYQLLGQMSADEKLKIAPPVRRVLTQMVAGLKQDIGNAADQVGRAADYYKGMGNYSAAAKQQEWYQAAKDFLAKQGIKAAGGGILGAAGYEAYKQANK